MTQDIEVHEFQNFSFPVTQESQKWCEILIKGIVFFWGGGNGSLSRRGSWTLEGRLYGGKICSCALFAPLNGSFLYYCYYGSEKQL